MSILMLNMLTKNLQNLGLISELWKQTMNTQCGHEESNELAKDIDGTCAGRTGMPQGFQIHLV